jgi:hypothetical protein
MLFYLGNLILYGNKKDIPTKEKKKSQKTWLYEAHGHQRWPKSLEKTKSQGPKENKSLNYVA